MKRDPVTSSRREFLGMSAGSALFATSPLALIEFGGSEDSLNPIDELIRLEVKLASWVREKSPDILGAPLDESRHNWLWVDYGFRWPAFTLAHLYSTRHPDNSLFGEHWCAKLAMDLLDKEVDYWRFGQDRGSPISTGETPHYVAAYVLHTLADQIDEERRESWLAHEKAWVDRAMRRPLGMTGGYHDSWRMTALYRLGQVLGHAEWCEMGIYLFERLLRLQTNEGFWEDGRHHGPSARYCGLMLPSLAWMYRWTQKETFHRAAVRLADFMATFAYPDALTVGAFDGRNSNALAYFPICPGLELSEKGRAYNLRAFELWREMGMLEDISIAAQSSRDLARLAFYSADTCLYLGMYASEPEAVVSASPVPIETNPVLENHSTQFDGVMFRNGPWVGAISGQNSEMKGVFRLERESRIEIWHEQARLILGGGHHRQDWRIPHANAILDTGFAGPTEFGMPAGEGMEQVPRVYYKPRVASSVFKNGSGTLNLIFGHGVVSFEIRFSGPEIGVIEARWEVRELDRLCLQLPVTIWRGCQLKLDGLTVEREENQERWGKKSLSVSSPSARGFSLEFPEHTATRIHFPIDTGVFHQGAKKHREMDPIRNPYQIAVVSCQWTNPAKEGRAIFKIRV